MPNGRTRANSPRGVGSHRTSHMQFRRALPSTIYGDVILAERIFSQSAPGEVSRAYFRMLGTCVHRVRTCPDMFRHVQTCPDTCLSRHDTHHTSRRLAYFRLTRQLSQFAPKPCIFSHTIPVRVLCTVYITGRVFFVHPSVKYCV